MDETLTPSRYKLTLRNVGAPEKKRIQVVTARSEKEAASKGKLLSGWEVIEITQETSAKSTLLSFFERKSKDERVSNTEVVRFCKGLAIMLRAGIPTVEGIKFYAANLPNQQIAGIFRGISADIESGEAPGLAFSKTGKFSVLFVGLVTAGVTSGTLESALESIAHQMTILSTFKKRLKRIIITPSGILIFLLALFIAAHEITS